MESMVNNLFNSIYKNKRVLLTGHTGFKGTWLALWLQQMGAEVIGYSLAPDTIPNHFNLLKTDYPSYFANVNDLATMQKVFLQHQPDIVFHLAAQPLVRYSYQNPIETHTTNIIGTANILECSRQTESVKAVVVVTSDKCYENIEQQKGYVETDRMGGYDPYSASKGCAELITSSYRNSFFNNNDFGKKHHTLIASARAGNVIGGGDWSADRLIPDIIRGAVEKKSAIIRSPKSTRPWQHVLEPLSGYLLLGQKLLAKDVRFAEGWNFGPAENEVLTVAEVLQTAKQNWGKINYEIQIDPNAVHEAKLLSLNCEKANNILRWQPIWDNPTSIAKTIQWYKYFYENNEVVTSEQLQEYILSATSKKLIWTI